MDMNETDEIVHLEDEANERGIEDADFNLSSVVATVKERFQRAETARLGDETRWLESYRNFRGLYGPETQFREDEKSKVFVKITKTKVVAAHGQLSDVLFSTGRFPLSVEPTEKPEGAAEMLHITAKPKEPEAKQPEDPYGWKGDGRDVVTVKTLAGPLYNAKMEEFNVQEGPTADPEAVTIEPAAYAAKRMEKTILDQLGESNATDVLRRATFEMVLLGTGIIKGPFTESKVYNNWDYDEKTKEGVYNPIVKDVPKLEAVSLWNFYPDPSGVTMEDIEWNVQYHPLNRTQLRALKRQPFFRSEAIELVISRGPNRTPRWFESELSDDHLDDVGAERWEVLEYWGVIDVEDAKEEGIKIPKSMEDLDQVQINAWVCGDTLLRLVLNPFKPTRLPYLACPYEVNPYSFFGVGVPENMSDAQLIMNGHARLAIDNMALSGNVILEVDENALAPGQDLKLYPGKVFRRIGGVPGQSIFGINIPNRTNENMQMFDKFRQLADEATGIPSYSHGQTGVSGTTRTASGMSMLMGAAALNIKTVVKNVDDYLLRPLGEAYFSWNMQFNYDPKIKGDLDIKARGTSSLMQKEVRSQRLMMFMQTASNPALAPFVKWPTVLSEIAQSMDIDPSKFVNDPNEAKLQAILLQGFTNGQNAGPQAAGSNQPPGGMGGVPNMGGAPSPTDPTGSGGGTIGTGVAPSAGEAGFSPSGGQVAPRPQGMGGF